MKAARILTSAILTGATLLAIAPSVQAQTTIAGWDFDSIGTQAAPYNSPVADQGAESGMATASTLGMTNSYTFGGGEGPGSVAADDVLATSGASTGTGSFGWRVRGNGNTTNSGPGVANGWNSNAPIGTQGALFPVNTTGFSNITLSLDLNATGQAERNLAVIYSLDGTFDDAAVATITSAGSAATLEDNTTSSNTVLGDYVELKGTGTGWNNLITASFPAGANNDPSFAVEIVNASTGADDVNTSGAALNNSSGNWRYDNVEVGGVTAVPEPSSLAAAVGGLGLLLGFSRSRRVSRQA
jgi:hypothetical protein